ncbi:MAG: hypothetical protein JWQ53_1229 [Klenkia sp.]|nr:hypothetical protein [Klenkia sp.]
MTDLPATVTGATRDDDERWVVTEHLETQHLETQHLEGDVPGGVVDLAHRFTLRGDRIAELHIAP